MNYLNVKLHHESTRVYGVVNTWLELLDVIFLIFRRTRFFGRNEIQAFSGNFFVVTIGRRIQI
jgi:hypothetical protein